MQLKEMQEKISKVSKKYTETFGIKPNNDWYILKLQEEIGELTKDYMSYVGLARQRGKSKGELKKDFENELSDVFAHALLIADHFDIDLENALEKKWFKYLK